MRGSRVEESWCELTTLAFFNAEDPTAAQLYFLDGNENVIARHFSQVVKQIFGELDVDEINVCRKLKAAGLPVPKIGMVMVQSDLEGDGHRQLYGWAKAYRGRFSMDRDEPDDGIIMGIAKTECRIVPDIPTAIPEDLPNIDLVYIGDTEETP
jgi:hypothetical protein